LIDQVSKPSTLPNWMRASSTSSLPPCATIISLLLGSRGSMKISSLPPQKVSTKTSSSEGGLSAIILSDSSGPTRWTVRSLGLSSLMACLATEMTGPSGQTPPSVPYRTLPSWSTTILKPGLAIEEPSTLTMVAMA